MLSRFGATTVSEPGLPAGHPFTAAGASGDLLWTSTQNRGSAFPVHDQVTCLAGVYEPFANPTSDGGGSHVLCVRSPGASTNLPS